MENCKKCGNTPNLVTYVDYKGKKQYYVACPVCGQHAPDSPKPEKAVLWWDVRNI